MTLKEIFSDSNLFFSSYFLVPPDKTENVFLYTNDSARTETARAIIFSAEGVNGPDWKMIEKTLGSNDSFILNTGEIDTLTEFKEGSIMLCLKIHGEFDKSVLRKEFVSTWMSSASGATTGAMTSAGPFPSLNMPETKGKKSFCMLTPVIAKPLQISTRSVLINHSTDPDYQDTAEVIPTLSNRNGEMIKGEKISIPPFGVGVTDIPKYFGKAGEELLLRSGGYGSFTAFKLGHIFVSYFFQLDNDGNFVCGNHTQPPPGIMLPFTHWQIIKERIKQVFPWLMYLRKTQQVKTEQDGL